MHLPGIFSSIRFKIAAAFSLVFIAIAFITNFLIFTYLRENLLDTHRRFLYQEATGIVNDVRVDPVQIPITDEAQLIYVWYESFSANYPVYEKTGFPIEVLPFFQEAAVETAGVDEFEFSKTLTLDTVDIIMAQRALFDADNGIIKLLLMQDNQAIYGQIASIRTNLIWANVLSILLSSLLAYIVSGLSLKPIQKVIAKAQVVQASEQMERLPLPRVKDEIGELSLTINEMIERIESSIKNQNQFFAMAAHELRTPLANMQSELEYRISTSEKEVNRETLTSLREEVIRLKNIVQDFLLMSQLKSETLVLRKSNFRLDDLLYDTLERMRPALTKNALELKLSIDVAPEKLRLHADREKLEGVLVNLFDNARKYGSNARPITVQITETENTLSLTIQNALATNPPILQKGMGLGLQIAQRIVEKHGFGFEKEEGEAVFEVRLEF
ncbi:MAG: hypothetical protein Roseis2KO_25140 [Roseivirga sp.]